MALPLQALYTPVQAKIHDDIIGHMTYTVYIIPVLSQPPRAMIASYMDKYNKLKCMTNSMVLDD